MIYGAKSTDDEHAHPDPAGGLPRVGRARGLAGGGEFADEAFRPTRATAGPACGAKALAVHAEHEALRPDRPGRRPLRPWCRRRAGQPPPGRDRPSRAQVGVTLRSVQDPQTSTAWARLRGRDGRAHHEDERPQEPVGAGRAKRRADSGKPVGALPIGYMAETTVVDGAVTKRVIDRDGARRGRAHLRAGRGRAHAGRHQPHAQRRGRADQAREAVDTRAVRTVIENRDYLGENGYPS